MKAPVCLALLLAIAGLLNAQPMTTEPTPCEQITFPEFDQLWDYSDPEATRARLDPVLADARRCAGTDYTLQLMTQVARTYSLQRRFAEAHALLDEAEAGLPGANVLTRVRYLLERGRTHNSAGEADIAMPLFHEAWELASTNGLDGYAVDAAHMLGIAAPSDSARLDWNLRALMLAESSEDEAARRWRGSLYNNLGWTYMDSGEYATALSLFRQAEEFRRLQADPKAYFIARYCVARAHRALNEPDAALEILNDLVRLEGEYGWNPDGYVHEEIGECLLMKGQSEEARPYFKTAWKALSADTWMRKNEKDRLDRLKKLGR